MEENVRDLVAKVRESKADVGIAYDGDADRVGIIDEQGRRHEADLILALLARDLLTRHPGAPIVFDVKSSQVLIDDIRKHGRASGDVEDRPLPPQAQDARGRILLGGEVSGHMFFAENWYGVDDGILASCKFLEAGGARDQAGVGALRHPAPALRHARAQGGLSDDKKFAVVAELAASSSGATRRWTSTGCASSFRRLGARARLQHQPLPHLRFEAKSQPALEAMQRTMYDALRRYPEVTLPA